MKIDYERAIVWTVAIALCIAFWVFWGAFLVAAFELVAGAGGA